MKKLLSKILIGTLALGIFLVPVSGQISIKTQQISVQKNQANAQNSVADFFQYLSNPGIAAAQHATKATANLVNSGTDEYGCGVNPRTWFTGCISLFLYTVIFTPLAFITRLAAQILDFFIYYSISSEAYRAGFVEKSWGVVRDISNMFFLLILLYIAIKTILNLNVSNNKRLIAKVLLIALLINFSLFTAKVIIDSSNILARVFYSNITAVNQQGQPLPADEDKGKSVTVGLVRTFDPHKIITDASNTGPFILVTLLAIGLMIYMIFMFISITMFFVGRVASLWIAMIFSPLAFATYALPFQLPGGMGWKSWWSELAKSAFMAPIFVFFLYIIVLFGGFFKEIEHDVAGSASYLDALMKTIIPFMLVYVLLMRAKKIAKDMSGEAGQAFSKAGAALGGFALGAATGGAALGLSKVAGVAGRATLKSERLKKLSNKKGLGGYGARMALRAADYGQKASFDIRKTKLSDQLSKQTGLNFQSSKAIGLGSKEGGSAGRLERKTAKRQKRMERDKELFKTSMTDDEVKAWSRRRRLKYFKGLEDAKKVGGIGEAEYKRRKGEAPKEYSSAKELNNERLQSYKDNLGNNDFVGAVAQSILRTVDKTGTITKDNFQDSQAYARAHKAQELESKRLEAFENGEEFDNAQFERTYKVEFDDKVAKTVNDAKIRDVRMAIGATAGGLTLGALGAAGGAFAAEKTSGAQRAAEAKVAENIAKELKGSKVKDEQLSGAKNRMNKYATNIESAVNDSSLKDDLRDVVKHTNENKDLPRDTNGDVKFEKDKDGNVKMAPVKIDSEKLSEAISKSSVEVSMLNENLLDLIRKRNQAGPAGNEADQLRARRDELRDKFARGELTSDETTEYSTINDRIEQAKSASSGVTQQDIDAARGELEKANIKAQKLKSLEGIEEKIDSTEKRIEEITGKKSGKKKDDGGEQKSDK